MLPQSCPEIDLTTVLAKVIIISTGLFMWGLFLGPTPWHDNSIVYGSEIDVIIPGLYEVSNLVL